MALYNEEMRQIVEDRYTAKARFPFNYYRDPAYSNITKEFLLFNKPP